MDALPTGFKTAGCQSYVDTLTVTITPQDIPKMYELFLRMVLLETLKAT